MPRAVAPGVGGRASCTAFGDDIILLKIGNSGIVVLSPRIGLAMLLALHLSCSRRAARPSASAAPSSQCRSPSSALRPGRLGIGPKCGKSALKAVRESESRIQRIGIPRSISRIEGPRRPRRGVLGQQTEAGDPGERRYRERSVAIPAIAERPATKGIATPPQPVEKRASFDGLWRLATMGHGTIQRAAAFRCRAAATLPA